MNESKSVFQTLSAIDVSKHVEEKNGYKYVSWASALEILLNVYPGATWEVREWDGVPYLRTGAGCFVEVSLIIQGTTRKQLHPILDYKNNPIKEPSAFQINTSIQRCLVKTMALHGLGLNIYAGEDLPLGEREAIEQMREELATLLKEAKIYDNNTRNYINKLDANTLRVKIDEYRGKNERQ